MTGMGAPSEVDFPPLYLAALLPLQDGGRKNAVGTPTRHSQRLAVSPDEAPRSPRPSLSIHGTAGPTWYATRIRGHLPPRHYIVLSANGAHRLQ